MTWKSGCFVSDEVTLTLWDIVKLLCGRVLSSSGCNVRIGRIKR